MKRILIVILAVVLTGCANKPATAPVPGSKDAVDAWAFRIIVDSTAAIHSVKIWEQCTAAGNPATVVVDLSVEPCDTTAGAFPMQFKPVLNTAITTLNTASQVAKAYHSGVSADAAGLNSVIGQLQAAVTALIASVGSSK